MPPSSSVNVFIYRKLLTYLLPRNGRDLSLMMALYYLQQSGDVTGTAGVLHVPSLNPPQQPDGNVHFGSDAAFGDASCSVNMRLKKEA